MNLTPQALARDVAATGFGAEPLEKVFRLMALLDALNSHPFLKTRIALKGGTALNLFHFNVPRLSVDIDLNYVGAVGSSPRGAGVLAHLVGVARDDRLVGAQAQRVLPLAGRRGERDDVGPQRVGELHAHVPQPADADHANLLPWPDAVLADGRPGRDPGAEQRCSAGEVEVRRHPASPNRRGGMTAGCAIALHHDAWDDSLVPRSG